MIIQAIIQPEINRIFISIPYRYFGSVLVLRKVCLITWAAIYSHQDAMKTDKSGKVALRL
jgi:hypothetical protein